MREQRLDLRATELGATMLAGFRERLGDQDGIREIRGKGLMFGLELELDCSELVRLALERRLLINVTRGNVVRLLPPLIISDEEAEQVVGGVSDLISSYLSGH